MVQYCRKCGKELDDDAEFCDGCGFNLNNHPTESKQEESKKEIKTIQSKNDKKELVFETEYKNYPKVVMKDEVLKGKVVSDTPKTGDNSNVWMYCGICMLSLVVMIFVHVLRRKRGNA